MIRALLWLIAIGFVIYVGTSVQLGRRTLFGHVRAVWATDEMQEMKTGIEEKTTPLVDRAKRGIEAGVKAARNPAATTDPGVPSDATPAVPPKPVIDAMTRKSK